MKVEIGDYLITTDSRCFVLREKTPTIITDKTTKEQAEIHVALGYFTHFDSLVKRLGERIMLDNEDMKVIQDKLDRLNKTVKELNFNKVKLN